MFVSRFRTAMDLVESVVSNFGMRNGASNMELHVSYLRMRLGTATFTAAQQYGRQSGPECAKHVLEVCKTSLCKLLLVMKGQTSLAVAVSLCTCLLGNLLAYRGCE